MLHRLSALAALGALAGPACYESHAAQSDASGLPDDADLDVRDGAEAEAHDGADADGRDDGGTDVAVGLCTGDDIIVAADLMARAAELDGRTVRVRGMMSEADARGCTSEPCPVDHPCCNVCSVGVRLTGPGSLGPLIRGSGAAEPGCSGDECHLVCTPYDVGRRYVLRGLFTAETPTGPTLTVVGGPGDVCEDEPPPDHRGSYGVRAKSWTITGRPDECARWQAATTETAGLLFVSIGDPGLVEVWQGLATPPGSGRLQGTISTSGSRATFSATEIWSCCTHSIDGVFPDSRAVEATLTVHEEGYPACDAVFELVGMRVDAWCADDLDDHACFRAGGIRGYVGPDTGVVCSCPTYDGNRRCIAGSPCQGACLANPVDGSCTGLDVGRCTRGLRWAGCYCQLDEGRATAPTCWD